MKIKFIELTGSFGGVALALALAASAAAGPVTDSVTYSPNVVIPDNDLNGVANPVTISTPIQSIIDVQVSLDISGGYDGDFYAYLTHGSTDFVVLLNRIGVNSGSQFGSDDSGMNVTLSDAGAGNIHDAPSNGGVLTGTFKPDGRNVSPVTTLPGDLEATPSTTPLSTFDGSNPNGGWMLYIADTSPGGIGTLESWTLDITGNTAITTGVPDSSDTFALFALSGGLLFALRRSREGRWNYVRRSAPSF